MPIRIALNRAINTNCYKECKVIKFSFFVQNSTITLEDMFTVTYKAKKFLSYNPAIMNFDIY